MEANDTDLLNVTSPKRSVRERDVRRDREDDQQITLNR